VRSRLGRFHGPDQNNSPRNVSMPLPKNKEEKLSLRTRRKVLQFLISCDKFHSSKTNSKGQSVLYSRLMPSFKKLLQIPLILDLKSIITKSTLSYIYILTHSFVFRVVDPILVIKPHLTILEP